MNIFSTFQHSIGDIRLESLRTIINGNLILEKTLASETIQSFNGSLQILSDEGIQMESGNSAFILGEHIQQTR